MSARRVIATISPKGGVGKTFLAKVLLDLLEAGGRVVAAWDLDASTGTFAVYHDSIKTFDLNASCDTYSWLDDCYRDDIDDVIIDVPGGHMDDLLRTFGNGNVGALVAAVNASGREMVVAVPVGTMIAETVTAQIILEAFSGTTARVVIVKNGRFGNADDFVIFDGVEVDGERRYGATADLAASIGAETIFLPCLAPRLLAQIDAERLRLGDGARAAGAQVLGRLGAARVDMYLASAQTELRGTSLSIDGVMPHRNPSR